MSDEEMTRYWNEHTPAVLLKNPLNGQVLVQLLTVRTCPKCQGYMQTIPVDLLSAKLISCHGRWRCGKCGYIPSLDVYDLKGVEHDKILIRTENP